MSGIRFQWVFDSKSVDKYQTNKTNKNRIEKNVSYQYSVIVSIFIKWNFTKKKMSIQYTRYSLAGVKCLLNIHIIWMQICIQKRKSKEKKKLNDWCCSINFHFVWNQKKITHTQTKHAKHHLLYKRKFISADQINQAAKSEQNWKI